MLELKKLSPRIDAENARMLLTLSSDAVFNSLELEHSVILSRSLAIIRLRIIEIWHTRSIEEFPIILSLWPTGLYCD